MEDNTVACWSAALSRFFILCNRGQVTKIASETVVLSSVISTITGICRAKVNGAKVCRIQYGCRMTKDAFEKGFATLFAAKTIAEKRNEV